MHWVFADFEDAFDPTDMQDFVGLKAKKIASESMGSYA
jgi:hypothetical protein